LYFAVAFNQSLSSWTTTHVTDMSEMFRQAYRFDQNLGAWNISNVTDMTDMLESAFLSAANYNALLTGWAAQSVKANVPFHAGLSQYASSGGSGRTTLASTKGWTIADGGIY
jgi:Mycoplasma protein of unknown function, DUF285